MNKIIHNDRVTILWNINKNYLYVKINRPINLTSLLKRLLANVKELRNFKYKRKSQYGILHESNKNIQGHRYAIRFQDIRDNFIKTKEILITDSSMNMSQGEYYFFIPDLLEIAVERGLVNHN